MKKKIIAMLLCAAMVGTMLTGCGEKKEEDNRELVLYTWEGLFPQEVLDQFEEEKGIKIISSNFDSTKPCWKRCNSPMERIMTLSLEMTILLSRL